jgi:hypothetical protein
MQPRRRLLTALGLAVGVIALAGAAPAQIQIPCPECDPPPCIPGVFCGAIDPSTVTGAFHHQKDNNVCVYTCMGKRTCTEVFEDCSQGDPFQVDANYRARVPGYAKDQCPKDAVTATALCRNEAGDH